MDTTNFYSRMKSDWNCLYLVCPLEPYHIPDLLFLRIHCFNYKIVIWSIHFLVRIDRFCFFSIFLIPKNITNSVTKPLIPSNARSSKILCLVSSDPYEKMDRLEIFIYSPKSCIWSWSKEENNMIVNCKEKITINDLLCWCKSAQSFF